MSPIEADSVLASEHLPGVVDPAASISLDLAARFAGAAACPRTSGLVVPVAAAI